MNNRLTSHNVKESVATVTSKGQVTIPSVVRKHLGLNREDKVVFTIMPEGTVQLQAPTFPTVASLRGAAGSLQTPLPWNKVRLIARNARLSAKFPRQS